MTFLKPIFIYNLTFFSHPHKVVDGYKRNGSK